MANNKPALKLIIRNRQKVVFEGEVQAVSSVNDKGGFDVLPKHSNFISIIKEKIVVLKKDKEKQTFLIKSGIMNVRANQVEIYLDIVSPKGEEELLIV